MDRILGKIIQHKFENFQLFLIRHSIVTEFCLVERPVRSGSVWSAPQNARIERLPMADI